MHRKITAFVAFTTVVVSLFFFSSSPVAKGRSVKKVPSDPGTITASFPTIEGIIAQPAQVLEVKWTLEGEGVRYFESHPWSECELFFSPDSGQSWSRISPQLSVSRRSFSWWVPNVSTQAGMLALHIGIEGDGEYYVFHSGPFSVLSPDQVPRS